MLPILFALIVKDGFDVYTGANNLADDNTYVYAVTNDSFDWDNLPFGISIYSLPFK